MLEQLFYIIFIILTSSIFISFGFFFYFGSKDEPSEKNTIIVTNSFDFLMFSTLSILVLCYFIGPSIFI